MLDYYKRNNYGAVALATAFALNPNKPNKEGNNKNAFDILSKI